MNSNVIRAAMALREIPASLIAEKAGVSTSAVHKTIRGVRSSSHVLKVVEELLGDDIRALQGEADEMDDHRRAV